MRRIPVGVILAICLAASLSTSGCLRDEVFPEPYGWTDGAVLEGRGEMARRLDVPSEAQRLRFTFEVAVANQPSIPLSGVSGVELRLRDEQGRVHSYNVSRDATVRDTFGGGVGGPWSITVGDPQGQSEHRLRIEWYAPKHADWAWWQVWRR